MWLGCTEQRLIALRRATRTISGGPRVPVRLLESVNGNPGVSDGKIEPEPQPAPAPLNRIYDKRRYRRI
jgi:hypothetical protein